MSQSDKSQREHPSTYIVQDRQNQNELERLAVQDQMVTVEMGGVLPEQPDPTIFHSVLDVACGTGGWLIQTAKTYPTIARLVGIDISGKMIEYARAQAEAQQVSNRVEFRTMDALRMLEFPAHSFDLVNLRFGTSFLRTWDWSKLINEMLRVARPGGTIRITDGQLVGTTSSPALMKLCEIFLDAFKQSGHLFTAGSSGVIDHLERLLKEHGCEQVRTKVYTLEHRAGTPEGQGVYEDMKRLFQTARPFLQKWTRLPGDYDALYQQALIEMQQPDFVEIGNCLTAWGLKPLRKTL